MSDFCLIVTSRGRPDNWARLHEWLGVMTERGLNVWLVLDDDDPTRDQYVIPEGRPMVDVQVGPRLGHIQSLNHWAPIAARSGFSIVGQMGDDHLPRTKGWDQRIREALATPGIAYGNDLFQGANLPTAVFFSSEIIRVTGKFAPEGLWHLYADNYWRDLGNAAGCLRYLPDVVIEHLHPAANKSEWDETYEDSNASDVDQADRIAWERYCESGQFKHDVVAVRAVL